MANYKQLSWTQLQTTPVHDELLPEQYERTSRRPDGQVVDRPIERRPFDSRSSENSSFNHTAVVTERPDVLADVQTESRSVVDALDFDMSDQSFGDLMGPEETMPERKRIDAQGVWQMMQSELALQIPSATYETWVKDTWVVAYEDGEFIIGVPHAYARDWLTNRLRGIIKRTLSGILKHSVQVNFRVHARTDDDSVDAADSPLYQRQATERSFPDRPSQKPIPRPSPSRPAPARPAPARPSPARSIDPRGNGRISPSVESDRGRRDVRSIYQDDPQRMREEGRREADPRTRLERGRIEERSSSGQVQGRANDENESRLNRQHTFESFVVGRHNQLAHAAALAVTEKPGQQFSPLFIYGGVGLGKTHLLNAIGNRLSGDGYRTLYCSSEQFTNELVGAIRRKETGRFRDKYRAVDVLLIDDIQFFSGKESTQEEFFHTFNELQSAGSQIVISGEHPPSGLTNLKERLRSRFEGGLQADVAQPDFEARFAILQSKAAHTQMPIPVDVLMLVAERMDSNIRELEGFLNRLCLQNQFSKKPLTAQVAEHLLEARTSQEPRCESDDIIDIVASYFHLRPDDLVGKGRANRNVYARQIAMYLMREAGNMSLPIIGKKLGGRDHSTVRYGAEKVSRNFQTDETLRRDVMNLRQKIL